LRVLVVGLNYTPESSGIAPYTTALSEGLAERGYQVRVITTMPHYPEWKIASGYDRWGYRESIGGVGVRRLRHYVPSNPSGLRRLISEVTFGIRAAATRWGRPDAVLFVSPALFSTGIAMLRARLAQLPNLVWVQDVYSSGMVETRGQAGDSGVVRVIRAVESAVLRSADEVTVIHDRFIQIVTELGARPQGVHVVRNWTHLRPVPQEDRRLTRQRLNWNRDETVVLHSGAMGRKQHLENVVAAARLADEQDAPVHFVLMGNGAERARLEAAAVGVRSITFLDPLPADEYQPTLNAADALLVNEHAGLREMAVPSKLTSYFSSGRPVIAATDKGSVTAFEVASAKAGVRVEPADPPALLAAALELRADPERSSVLGQNGRRYQERTLSEHAAINGFERILDRLVFASAPPRRSGLLHWFGPTRTGRDARAHESAGALHEPGLD
jgi:colanic acid biosynthesis glycosyl transferase WcaI